MKKFLLAAVLIFGVVVSQIVAVPRAEAYQPSEGDIAQVWYYRCSHCDSTASKARIISTRYGVLEDPEPGTYGCSKRSIGHSWRYTVYIKYSYRNGQWVETDRTTY